MIAPSITHQYFTDHSRGDKNIRFYCICPETAEEFCLNSVRNLVERWFEMSFIIQVGGYFSLKTINGQRHDVNVSIL